LSGSISAEALPVFGVIVPMDVPESHDILGEAVGFIDENIIQSRQIVDKT